MTSNVPTSYTAQPPGLLGSGDSGGLLVQCKRIFRGLWTMLWVPFVPFNPTPEPILVPPEPEDDVHPDMLAQCEKIYERTEATRKFVEEKARATFTILAFLAPLIGASFVFLLSQADQASVAYEVAKWLIIGSGALTFIAFISIVRATAVKSHMDMLLNTVIDEPNKKFKKYNPKDYVRGLLYCASWNGGLNAHVAQFVRGAHVLISLSVVLSFIAAVPLATAYADASSKQASEAKQNPVALQLSVLHQDLVVLRHDLASREAALVAAPAPASDGVAASGGTVAAPRTAAGHKGRSPRRRLAHDR
jgi:hypothetical protein